MIAATFHQAIVLPDDRSASDVARRITGDETRWPELVAVNHQKRKSRAGGFDFLVDGERLWLPTHWPKDPFAHMTVYPSSGGGSKRFESGAGALSTVNLPNGWTDQDLQAVIVMANDLGIADPKALLYVWASETGVSASGQLNPATHLDAQQGSDGVYRVGGMPYNDPWAPFFAGGLNGSTAPVCRSMGFKSAQDWLGGTLERLAGQTIMVQLQGIFRQYQNHVRALGEGFGARARRLGTTEAALIYAFNFLPAYIPGLKSATSPITSAGSPFYDTNRVLDTTVPKKGYISVRDFERLTAPNRWPAGWPVYALTQRVDALAADTATIASLGPTGAGVWSAISDLWTNLTGKNVHTNERYPIDEAPRARHDSAKYDRDHWSPTQYWQATGAVIFTGFLLAYAHGWIKR